jgi:hypothetical protein
MWRMLAGNLPMPPSPTDPGRVQCVIGSDIREAQVPYVEKRVRDLILAEPARITPCPAGMPGIDRSQVLALPGTNGSDLRFVSGHVPGSPHPPRTWSLTEAREEGILLLSDAAAKKAAQRPGFPDPVIKAGPGSASRWLGSDLAAWQKARVL